MPIAFDSVTQGPAWTNTSTQSFSHTASGNNRIAIVWVVGGAGSDITSNLQNVWVTYGGSYMSAAGGCWTGAWSTGTSQGQMFYMVDPPSGTQTVSVNASINIGIGGYRCACITYTGVKGVADHGYRTGGASTSLVAHALYSETGSLVVTGFGIDSTSTNTFTSGTGTFRLNLYGSGNYTTIGLMEQSGGASTTTPSCSFALSRVWCVAALTLIPVESMSVALKYSPALNTGGLQISGSSTTLATSNTMTLQASDSKTCLIVAVVLSLTTTAGTVTCSVTYGGVAMKQWDLQQGSSTGGNEAIGIYYLFNPGTGLKTLSVSTGGTTTKTAITGGGFCYYNVNCLTATKTVTATSTAPYTDNAVTTEGSRVMGIFSSDNATVGRYGNYSQRVWFSANVTGTGDNGIVYDAKAYDRQYTYIGTTLGASVRWRAVSVTIVPEVGQFFNTF